MASSSAEPASSGSGGPAPTVTPEQIMQLGLGFWGSKTLLSAIELGLFSTLASGPASEAQLRKRLDLHERSCRDFLDALVALGMLERGPDGYRNTPATDLFLDRAKPAHVGGLLERANARLYGFWNPLTEALHTGELQNEAKSGNAGRSKRSTAIRRFASLPRGDGRHQRRRRDRDRKRVSLGPLPDVL
jgi:hypothetical protein